MVDINPTSFPADARNDMTGTIRYVLTKWLQNTDDMLPAKVIAYDRAKNRASVQPMISVVTTSNKIVSRASIASIPVLQLGGGGFVMSFPIRTGDLGWIKASDRDISLFLQSYTESQPNTARKHVFEDAVFIPDTMMKGVTIAAEDANNLVIQKDDGSTRMSFSTTGIGINGAADPNTMFDVQSTTQASLPWPRMTLAQRNAIPSPQDGMAVWVTDTHYLSTYNAGTMTWS